MDAVQRATVDLATSEAIKARYQRKWQEARDTYGPVSEEARRYYGKYLSECRTVTRTKRWLDACIFNDRAQRGKTGG